MTCGCGTAFEPTHGSQRHCSKRCKNLACRRRAGAQPRTVKLSPCPRCGTDFWPWKGGVDHARKFCSSECRRRPCKLKPARVRSCAWCEGPSTKRGQYCGSGCAKAACTRRKRLRRKGLRRSQVNITLAFVFDKDAGLCQLCYEPVDAALKAPHRRAGTIDHIVPLSKGGAHSKDNVQLAHYGW